MEKTHLEEFFDNELNKIHIDYKNKTISASDAAKKITKLCMLVKGWKGAEIIIFVGFALIIFEKTNPKPTIHDSLKYPTDSINFLN